MRLLGVVLFMGLFFGLNAQTINLDMLSPRLQEKVAEGTEDIFEINIILSDKLDVRALDQQITDDKLPLHERATLVITALQAKAEVTQEDLISFLRNTDGVVPNTIKSHWLANFVAVQVDFEVLKTLTFRNDLSIIDLNSNLLTTEYIVESEICAEEEFAPGGIEPGLRAINAPKMWELGYNGYGRTAFVADTGIDPTHPCLASNYKGLYFPEEIAWYEWQSNNTTPYDCQSHGTHVTGTVLGLDACTKDTIGVAHGALWIGGPILCGVGTADNIGAFEWAMNPDDDLSTMDDMPDVINNSWYDPQINNECSGVYIDVLNGLEAVGVAVIFSAGNFGPDPSTISPPHNINIDTLNSFTVAAVNANNSLNLIADFSSRGPSQCGGVGSRLIKPEVAGPGVNVRSCTPDNSFSYLSGTSMASPHVSGAILLLKQAFPYLTGRELKNALYQTCTDLGVNGEDNTYGRGMINVFAAFNWLVGEGHVAENPRVALDAELYGVATRELECNSEVRPIIKVGNAGDSLITSLDVHYQIDDMNNTSGTFNWTGTLLPRTEIEIRLDPIPLDQGEYRMDVEISNPNGEVEDRVLNNKVFTVINVIDKDYLETSISIDDTIRICRNSNAILFVDVPDNSIINWYDEIDDPFSIGSGNNFPTPSLIGDEDFFVEVRHSTFVGKEALDDNNSDIGNNNGAVVFDVYSQAFLKSVKIFAEDSGGRFIALLDGEGVEVEQRLIQIAEPGENTVELNINLPPGENYQLTHKAGGSFYYDTEGGGYPFEIDGVVTIKGSNFGSNPNSPYFYFYDFNIEYDEPCGRAEIFVEVTDSLEAPVASFSVPADTVFTNDAITFTDLSQNAVNWSWDFGNNQNSTDQNPVYSYTEVGEYTVGLSVLNEDNCFDYAGRNIVVIDSLTSGIDNPTDIAGIIQVVPNPVHDHLEIRMQMESSQKMDFTIVNAIGVKMYSLMNKSIYLDTVDVETNGWAQGVYYLIINVEGGRVIHKFVKL